MMNTFGGRNVYSLCSTGCFICKQTNVHFIMTCTPDQTHKNRMPQKHTSPNSKATTVLLPILVAPTTIALVM